MTPRLPQTISTSRLDLITLDADQLSLLGSVAVGDFATSPGWTNPNGLFLGAQSWTGPLFAKRLADDERNTTWLARAIVERETSTLVGHIGCHFAPSVDGTVEYGYTIAESRRRQGIASEAIRGLAAACYATGAVKMIRVSIDVDNHASLALIMRLEFVHVVAVDDERDSPELVFERNARDLVSSSVILRDN